MTHVEAQLAQADWLFGAAAVMTTIPSIIAAIAALKSNAKAREAKETAAATHNVVVEKLDESKAIVDTLGAYAEEAHSRQAIMDEYIQWRRTQH